MTTSQGNGYGTQSIPSNHFKNHSHQSGLTPDIDLAARAHWPARRGPL